jgi:hypothetical protein
MVLPHVGKPSLYPESKFSAFSMPTVAGTNHWHDWVDAALAGKKTTDGFDYAGPLSETVQLGNVAARLPGQRLEWDTTALNVTNNEAAAKLLKKSYRAGFEVEPVA